MGVLAGESLQLVRLVGIVKQEKRIVGILDLLLGFLFSVLQDVGIEDVGHLEIKPGIVPHVAGHLPSGIQRTGGEFQRDNVGDIL